MKELFDITKIIFEKPEEWETVTVGEKRKYYFPIQRRFAIQFPMQANALQHLKISQESVIDFWQNFMRKKYKQTPGWMYTKGVKKSKQEKERKINISNTLIDEYVKRIGIDKKSVYDALEHYTDLMKKELKSFEKIMNQK